MIFYKPLSIAFLERTRLGSRRVLALLRDGVDWLRNCLETYEEFRERRLRERRMRTLNFELREDPDRVKRKMLEDSRRHGDFELAEEMRRRRGEDAHSASA